MFRWIGLLSLATVSSAALALEPWMEDEALREAFADKTLQGNYANGKAFVEVYRADGSIEYREQGIEYHGHWSLQAGSFCTIYDGDPTGGCYRVRQVSANCYEFYFVSRTEEQAAKRDFTGPAWTARAAVSDRSATCEDKAAV